MAADDRSLGPTTSAYLRVAIRVRGSVQGVGFRPFVHREATALGLGGWVSNTSEGVTVEAEGRSDRLQALVQVIRGAPPPNAVVEAIEVSETKVLGESAFAIHPSILTGTRTASVLVDLASCEACIAELFDPSNRRYRYPFTNCTDCGPRFTIVEDLPYDRARTSMRQFVMCGGCQAEYDDPGSRRFHAEPNACPDCGPRLVLRDRSGGSIALGEEALVLAAAAIRRGEIVAMKGIGGFHLLVDARDEGAVQRLRARKHRPDKPFAVMFPTLDEVRACCRLSPEEEALLHGRERPIVLLERFGDAVADAVAPRNPLLGVLLPYSPLHHLLMAELGFPVLATSGNLGEEAIVIDDGEALERLADIADHVLGHDRPIVRPAEDSVVRVVCGQPLMLRRGRGYAPAPVPVTGVTEGVLALGGHLKTTVALSRDDSVIVWPHIGDLETVDARAAHAGAARDILRIHAVRPHLIAHDLHPDYASTFLAGSFAAPVASIPHHLAHVVACMADNRVVTQVLGVAWDGAGYGADGTIWGGEFLKVDKNGWRRVAHLRPFRLPGGEAASREPRRSAFGLLHAMFGDDALAMDDLAPVATFTGAERRTLRAMLERGVNAPECSSIGRLFDAVAALAGLRQRTSFEGQAAMELEWAAAGRDGGRCYRLAIRQGETNDDDLMIDWEPALVELIADLRAGAAPEEISDAFHNGLAVAIVEVASRVGEARVLLTGGCFQNARLTEATVAALSEKGFEPMSHRWIPPNDGGLALGQAVWAAWAEAGDSRRCA